jgi:hypothetical protein
MENEEVLQSMRRDFVFELIGTVLKLVNPYQPKMAMASATATGSSV